MLIILASNVGLVHLNLGWNHLRRKGAHAIANALKVVVQLNYSVILHPLFFDIQPWNKTQNSCYFLFML